MEASQAKLYSEFIPLNATSVFSDNTAALAIEKKGAVTYRTKQIDVRYHHVMNAVSTGKIQLRQIQSAFQIADIMTKPFNRATMERLSPLLL